MTTENSLSPVRVTMQAGPGQPDPSPALERLYRGFEQELLVPLWTEIGDLMPLHPQSKATPHLWRWDRLKDLAARLVSRADEAGRLVPVGRGGERRAIALANPSLGGKPYATPTLWAAIQYLMPGEDAPEHRHTQHAFRFIVEGEGVWTVVGGDPIRMSRGDFLPQSGWNWHAHHNAATQPMAWIDGLDIPFSYYTARSARARSACGATPACGPCRSPTPCRPRRCWPTAGSTPTAHSPSSSRSSRKARP